MRLLCKSRIFPLFFTSSLSRSRRWWIWRDISCICIWCILSQLFIQWPALFDTNLVVWNRLFFGQVTAFCIIWTHIWTFQSCGIIFSNLFDYLIQLRLKLKIRLSNIPGWNWLLDCYICIINFTCYDLYRHHVLNW